MRLLGAFITLLLFLNSSNPQVLASPSMAFELREVHEQEEQALDSAELAQRLGETNKLVSLLQKEIDSKNLAANTNEQAQWALIAISLFGSLFVLMRFRPVRSGAKDRRPIIELQTLTRAFEANKEEKEAPLVVDKPDLGAIKKELEDYVNLRLLSVKPDKPSNLLQDSRAGQKEGAKNRSHEADPTAKVLYFSSPGRDGIFMNSSAKKHLSTQDSVYKLLVDGSDPNIAEIEFIEQYESISKAITFPEDYVKPVCDDEGTYSTNARKVRQMQRGQAMLRGNEWKVVKKVKIEYS